ncbi:MAD2 [Candida metapsilosis]|uniref:MAD2 n=1 Tax=Candida metapsilosis TaxID=273372 RepID=A0A8H7ZLH7_9ASCO|nr:MAD2 [Candida metapsilosis]
MSASKLALKGSSKIVSDYFEFAINSILFQRGIYPAEDFITVRKYDLPMVINNDDDVKTYISNIMQQLKKWIYGKKITKLIVVIVSTSTGESIERWEFNVETKEEDEEVEEDKEGNADGNEKQREDGKSKKPKSEIQKEIRAIIRQITSSVSYLPILRDDEYTFNVLVYTDKDANVPIQWCDTNGDGRILKGDNVDEIDFASFSTDKHKVKTSVSYKFE